MTKEMKSVETPTEVAPAPTKKGSVPWKRINRGVEVPQGTNWVTGLTHEQRVMHMNKHEQFWKQKYNQQRGTVALQQNWTRG